MPTSATSNPPLPNPFYGTQATDYLRRESGAAAAAPGVPTSPLGVILSTSSVRVSWVAPVGAKPQSYDITSTPASISISVGPKSTSIVVPFAFVTATGYVFKVAARNSAGSSAPASAASITPNP